MSESLKVLSCPGVRCGERYTSDILSQLSGTQLKLMEVRCAPLCVNTRQGRLMRRCPSCITASHASMIILPIKSWSWTTEQLHTISLNERVSCLAESLMSERLLRHSDETSPTYFSEPRSCCCTNNMTGMTDFRADMDF